MSIDSNFRRQDPSAETAPAGESGSSHSTAGAAEFGGRAMRQSIPPSVDRLATADIQRMPRLSPQQKLDAERGITPTQVVRGAVRLCIGGPDWLVTQIADVVELTLRKLGFKIVPMEKEDYERG